MAFLTTLPNLSWLDFEANPHQAGEAYVRTDRIFPMNIVISAESGRPNDRKVRRAKNKKRLSTFPYNFHYMRFKRKFFIKDDT